GAVHVRQAAEAEKLVLLNEQEVELNEKVMVIADDEKALAIAGIMGGLSSAVSDATTEIFLESGLPVIDVKLAKYQDQFELGQLRQTAVTLGYQEAISF
ncbi:phenylalanine--tRNA ligase beta subunit-related protein, partial [Klebsiella pneumoniae]|uniref:phenylalanine--tRNA ligase beta subunit-related protein n=1 Tax=Klebsiella pneumoniae TaxID=573 RepID=UPI001150A414